MNEASIALIALELAPLAAAAALFARSRLGHRIAAAIGFGDPPMWAQQEGPHGCNREGQISNPYQNR